MKHLFTAAAMLFSMTAFAQVGINNTSPKATLDITAKTTDGSKPEGLIIPQLSGSNIHTATAAGVYGSNQKGLIIYATSADSSPISTTANITAAGYYYFDGTNWQKISTGNTVSTSLASGNIYVGSASNVATAVSPTGDVTISNTGATSIGAGKVTTTHLANNAVNVAKLPAGATATTFLRGDGTWVTPTDTNTTYTAGSGLTLTGTSFSANDATTGTKGIVQLAGDLAGTAASPTVAKIQNKTVSSTAPTNGQVLKYNTTTSAWEPAADIDTNTTYTAGSGLTLTGTSFSANDATTSAKGIVQLAGDLTGTAASPTVAKIQSKAVSSTAPTNGQVLKYNTTTSAWEPAADTDTNTTYTGSASINLNGTSFERTALSGDVTASANSNTTTIAANAVTSAKIADGTVANADLANMAALTVKGNATNAAAAPTDIAAGTDGHVLRRSGTTLGFGTVDTAGITDGAVTSNKILDATVANADLNTGVGGIYKGSGALSGGNTSVDLGTNNLAFTSGATNGTSHFTVDGTTLNVDAVNNRVGIGTSSPGNLLEISSSSSNTGLKLPYGAAAGKILTSDAAGNSSWQTNNAVFIYSEVHATGSSQSFTTGNKVTFFHNIKGENIKAIYGNSYGWIDATQRWVAPYTGKYRVTTNMYFNSSSGANPRLYAYLNGSTTCNITSATNGSNDGTAYTSAIVSLNQNDYIEWKIPPGCTCFNATLFGADYYTFIRVESVE
ncbi:beta strand repeat-containing protein [Chryseobacterium taeanense]|uniref:beta strand repeat-containing protein n=1 Tax=Chryseobacterium taeanense TaxID=311334 RepID=UPI0035B4F570